MANMTALKSQIIPQYTKLSSSDADPHEIALGFAVGTFVEIVPAFGIKTLLTLANAGTIRKINRAAMLAALAIWNSVFILPVYFASLRVGRNFTKGSACTEMMDPFSGGISCFMRGFLPGALIVGGGISLAVVYVENIFYSESGSKLTKKPGKCPAFLLRIEVNLQILCLAQEEAL